MSKISIYCDGGCRGNQFDNNTGAWGVYLSFMGYEKFIKGSAINTTNNKMELQACIEGLKAIKENKRHMPVEVFVDSAYVYNGITSWINNWIKKGWKTSKKQPVENKDQWIELLNLKNSFKDITFTKVKGHADNLGNIKADKLVNEAMDSMTV